MARAVLWWRRRLLIAGVGAVLVAGVGLRLWLTQVWRPALLGYPDEIAYLTQAHLAGRGLLFSDPYRPAGYPLFLIVLHALHPTLGFVIAVQHLLGLLTAVVLYATVAAVARHRAVALLPAAVVALSGSQIYLEHAVLSDTLYTLLIASGLACAVRSRRASPRAELVWLAAAGVLIGLSVPVRSVGAFVAPVLVVWAAVRHGPWRGRLAAAAVAFAGIAVPLAAYLVAAHAATGAWGLTRTTGETLYARAAIFADCRRFTPPSGTAGLCQRPGVPRQSATQYMFAAGSPARRLFGQPPQGSQASWPPDARLESFALAAIVHQPLDYLSTTAQGLAKYVDPSLGTSTMIEWSHDTLIGELHNPGVASRAVDAVLADYPRQTYRHGSLRGVDSYARAAKVEGVPTVVLLVLMVIGLALAAWARPAAALLAATTAAMVLAPVALLFYGARYATPAYGPLAAGAALGIDGLIVRARGRRPRRGGT